MCVHYRSSKGHIFNDWNWPRLKHSSHSLDIFFRWTSVLPQLTSFHTHKKSTLFFENHPWSIKLNDINAYTQKLHKKSIKWKNNIKTSILFHTAGTYSLLLYYGSSPSKLSKLNSISFWLWALLEKKIDR